MKLELTMKISNWTGSTLNSKRTSSQELCCRQELGRTYTVGRSWERYSNAMMWHVPCAMMPLRQVE